MLRNIFLLRIAQQQQQVFQRVIIIFFSFVVITIALVFSLIYIWHLKVVALDFKFLSKKINK